MHTRSWSWSWSRAGALLALAASLAVTRAADKKLHRHLPCRSNVVPFYTVELPAPGITEAEAAHWKLCKKLDPNLDSCLKTAVNEAISEVASKGLKEFGILPIDPFKITEMTVTQGGNGPVSQELYLKNAEITGFSACRFKTIQSRLKNLTIKGTFENVPRISLVGEYKVKGKVLVFPISGEGRCNITMNDVYVEPHIYGKETIKDGKKYMEIETFGFPVMSPKTVVVYFENLFNGNKQLSDQMNKLLNENWRLLLKEAMPALQEAFGIVFRDTANKIMLSVPYDELFLD